MPRIITQSPVKRTLQPILCLFSVLIFRNGDKKLKIFRQAAFFRLFLRIYADIIVRKECLHERMHVVHKVISAQSYTDLHKSSSAGSLKSFYSLFVPDRSAPVVTAEHSDIVRQLC